ncbi:MAG: HEAT repeat domain-containing protein [Methanothrix sp.]|nr:HEAT repeat domain-containing protein [Methanothrix sp.]
MTFRSLPDRQYAWLDLYRLTQDKDDKVRERVAYALDVFFIFFPDKAWAWRELLKLTQDKNRSVRLIAANALQSVIFFVSNKEEAWQDLCNLAKDNDSEVRKKAVEGICWSFTRAPDKLLLCQTLHDLVDDSDNEIRMAVARALGSFFPYFPREQVWQDLDRLTRDSNPSVRSYSLYSSAKSSIFKATETDNDNSFQEYLVQAIDFFERSSKESWYNPAKFCLPFYRSFYLIMFRGNEAQSEANSYLIEAKDAVEQSKSKEILFEAVKSLSQALVNVQKAKDATIQDRQIYLDALRKSCERAAGFVSEADDRTPGAARTIERGLHIIKQNIRDELAEIETNSIRLLEATRYTPFESITNRTVERIRGLSGIEYGSNAESIMDSVVQDIIAMCRFLPEKSRESVCGLMDWGTLDFEKKVLLFRRAVTYCANQMENFSMQIRDKDDQIAYLRGEVLARLETINFHIFKINIRSGDVAQNLRSLECELQKMKKIKDDLDRVGRKLDDLGIHQQQVLWELQESTPKLIRELEEIIKKDELDDSGKQKVPRGLWHELLNRLQALKASPAGATLDLAAALSSIISLILTIHPMY